MYLPERYLQAKPGNPGWDTFVSTMMEYPEKATLEQALAACQTYFQEVDAGLYGPGVLIISPTGEIIRVVSCAAEDYLASGATSLMAMYKSLPSREGMAKYDTCLRLKDRGNPDSFRQQPRLIELDVPPTQAEISELFVEMRGGGWAPDYLIRVFGAKAVFPVGYTHTELAMSSHVDVMARVVYLGPERWAYMAGSVGDTTGECRGSGVDFLGVHTVCGDFADIVQLSGKYSWTAGWHEEPPGYIDDLYPEDAERVPEWYPANPPPTPEEWLVLQPVIQAWQSELSSEWDEEWAQNKEFFGEDDE